MSRLLFIVGCCLIGVTACGGGGPRSQAASNDAAALPLWVQQPPTAPGYLYAPGGGVVRKIAADNAKQEILAQIKVSIEGSLQTQTTYQSTEGSHERRSERLEEAVVNQVTQRVDMQDIVGLSIIKETTAPDGTVWVLAQLDRNEWATALRNQIADIDRQLAAAWQRFSAVDTASESAIGTAIRLQRQVMPLAIERDLLSRRYRFVNPRGSLPDPAVDLGALQAQLAGYLDTIPTAIQADQALNQLMPEIVNGLVGAGLPVVTDASKAMLLVDLKLQLTPRTVGGMQRLDGEITGTVQDVQAGRHLCGLRATARESGADLEIAKQRLLRSIAPKVAEALDASLVQELTPAR